jgi:hypothetical protein
MPALIIGTYFRRPKAPVELPNGDGTYTTYYFTPVDKNNPNSEHVATVTDAKHQQKLLAIAEGYYISEAQTTAEAAHAAANAVAKPHGHVQVPVVQPELGPPVVPVAPESSSPANEATNQASPTGDASGVTAAAQNLLALPLGAFKTALGDAGRPVLEEALRLEQSQLDDDVRPTYVKAIQAKLKA